MKFDVDLERNIFVKDGEEFRYVAGSFHYFRALPESWEEKLKRMKWAGLNAVDV
jgi:beta-galactosidase